MNGSDSSLKTKEKTESCEDLLCRRLPPKLARCYQWVEMEEVKRSRCPSRQQEGVELRRGEKREGRTVETILDEIDHQEKVTDFTTTSPTFNSLLSIGNHDNPCV